MKNAFFIILFFVIGFLAGFLFLKHASGPATQPAILQQTLIRATSSGTSQSTAVVLRVIDGDTIELADGERVRYIGMDAPETVDPKKPVQCYGPESSMRNSALVEGKTVRLTTDVQNKDIYGRLLRYVWLGDIMINLELVQEGYARAYPYPPDTTYANAFANAQFAAKTAHIGLWAACP